MSALTKVFVVLHVVMSMLLVAGMVVFVNKVDDANAAADSAKKALGVEKVAHEADNTKNLFERGEMQKQLAVYRDQGESLRTALHTAQDQVIAKDTELSAAIASKTVAENQALTSQQAVKVQLEANAAERKVNNDLRDTNVALEKKNGESEKRVADLDNNLGSLGTELRYRTEEVATLQKELQDARTRLAQVPVHQGPASPAPGPGASATPTAPPAVAIRGVVKSTFNIGDVQYATVSVGSADSVSEGTKFNVTDPAGTTFLGYLTIDKVGPNESSGHLQGPLVGSVQKGSGVVTGWN